MTPLITVIHSEIILRLRSWHKLTYPVLTCRYTPNKQTNFVHINCSLYLVGILLCGDSATYLVKSLSVLDRELFNFMLKCILLWITCMCTFTMSVSVSEGQFVLFGQLSDPHIAIVFRPTEWNNNVPSLCWNSLFQLEHALLTLAIVITCTSNQFALK